VSGCFFSEHSVHRLIVLLIDIMCLKIKMKFLSSAAYAVVLSPITGEYKQ